MVSIEEQIKNVQKKIEEQKKALNSIAKLLELIKELFKLNLEFRIKLAKVEAISEASYLIIEGVEPKKKRESSE